MFPQANNFFGRLADAAERDWHTRDSLAFFSGLKWLDGRPLVETIEPYRRRLLATALDTYRADGAPAYNFVLSGRAKKNWKSADLVLAAFYCLLIRESAGGNDCYILANDEDQAGDDLELAKKLVIVNTDLSAQLVVMQKQIRRRDDAGTLAILPARDAVGQHGKTALFLGFDEIHGYRSYDLFEALAPDPTRVDVLTWITSYDTIWNAAGVPLYDFKAIGRAGSDPRMLFSWYSGDLCTDPDFAHLEPELRANPSIGSWPEGRAYLDQQRRRLPTHKFRRLHLNLPGAPNGAFLDTGAVLGAINGGRTSSPRRLDVRHVAFVDMSGGSSDDATLSIAHKVGSRAVVDLVESQAGSAPFNPRTAIKKFAALIKSYGLSSVTGDNYAGETFKADFESEGISYRSSPLNKTELYEHLEPALNAREVDLPDIPKLQEQLLTLVLKGARIDHQSGDHDDWANAVAGAVWCAIGGEPMQARGIFEFYRREAEKVGYKESELPEVKLPVVNAKPPLDFGFTLGATPQVVGTIKVRVPKGTSCVFGQSGQKYPVVRGCVAVAAEDAESLMRLGWQRVEQAPEAAE
jgi:hypothetical protein